ncbi:MAG TPA: hypothetical protein VG816_00460 [Solirubrobacterales bacterium]|nr:hypothetical protein [Solirubrobacterales bacterium]
MFDTKGRRLRPSPAMAVAIAAMVLAMVGGAFAATGGPGGKGSSASASKAKKGARGPRGPRGATGPAGPVGPAGAKGDPGPAGGAGKDGTSVTSSQIPTSSAVCNHLGGSEFKGVSGTTTACNGATGFSEVLPPEATETGSWGARESAEPGSGLLPISFQIPLATAPEPVLVEPGETGVEGCPGIVEGLPTAEPGFLCLYTAFVNEATPEGFFKPVQAGAFPEEGASRAGAILNISHEANYIFFGSWAVTAEAE